MLYRESHIVEAVRWTGQNFPEILEMLPGNSSAVGQDSHRDRKTGEVVIPQPTEVIIVNAPPASSLWLKPGDWLVARGKNLKVIASSDFDHSYKQVSFKGPAG